MKSDLGQNDQDQVQTNEDVIQTDNNSGITRSESPEQTVAQRRSSIKSIKGLSKNKIFPQKLPPLKKKKMVKFNKIHQERSTSSLADGFEVKWDNMSYIVEKSSLELNLFKKSNTSYRVILKCLSGSFRSAELTAVMGPSGAGKSTLLACVCGKRTSGVSGDITIRGCNRINVSIISQNDYLTDKITLRESLLFASKVKNGRKKDHEEVIHNVVNSLGLEAVLDTRLGKCSGGQRRKISIALELVSNPNILILDEPTSGLDSSACYQIVENLRDLTQHKKNPMAIVATIHQPSARVFSLFHSIYVISHNGQAIYHGPPDKLVEHLNRLNIFVPEYHNPADYIAEIASGEQGEDCITKLSTNKLQTLNRLKVDENPKPSSSRKLAEISHTNRYSHFYHLFILMNRSFKLTVREPHLSWIRLIVSVIVGTMIGLLFGHSIGQVSGCQPRKETLYSSNPTDLYKNFEFEHKAIEENLGSIFFNCIFLLYGGLMPMIMVFPKEFNVVSKQFQNGWYSTVTYFLSKFITDLPISLIANTVYVTTWYILSEQIWDLWRFFMVWTLGLIIMLIGISQGMICSALFPKNPVSAGYLGVTSTTPMFLLSGFFVRTKRIPQYLLPLTKFSYTKHAFESWVIALYGFNRCWYPETNQTAVAPPWLKFLKTLTATMTDNNDSDDDLNYDNDSGEDEDAALNDILALFSGTTVAANNNNDKYQSMVMSEFQFTDDMLLSNCITLLISALVFQLFAYIIFVYKLKKTN